VIYNVGDKLECYSSSGKSVCTISADGINFEGLDWGDYDYTLDETYYPTNHDSVTLETGGIVCNGETIRSFMDVGNGDVQNNIQKTYQAIMNKWGSKWKYEYKNKEEKEMNKVLELYYERRINKLGEFFKEIKEQEYNELEVVKEFNNVVEEYNNKMQELMGKYREEDENMSLIHKTGYNEYPYVLSHAVKDDIVKSLGKQYEEDKKALLEEKETIAAVLSLSEDKDYQVEVLKNYGILDKKGMMVEDDE
jgi:hypothetical protein